jgi:hypothetical protein
MNRASTPSTAAIDSAFSTPRSDSVCTIVSTFSLVGSTYASRLAP